MPTGTVIAYNYAFFLPENIATLPGQDSRTTYTYSQDPLTKTISLLVHHKAISISPWMPNETFYLIDFKGIGLSLSANNRMLGTIESMTLSSKGGLETTFGQSSQMTNVTFDALAFSNLIYDALIKVPATLRNTLALDKFIDNLSDRIEGTNDANQFYISSNTHFLTYNLNGGNDWIELSSPSEAKFSFNGGAGNDTLVLNRTDAIYVADLTTGKIQARGGIAFFVTDFENITAQRSHLILSGSLKSEALDGGFVSDRIDGKDGNDTLFGNGGRDILFGGSGNDQFIYSDTTDEIYGGEGIDTFILPSDRFNSQYNRAYGTVSISLKSETMTSQIYDSPMIFTGIVVGIENILGGNAFDRLEGNALANTLFGAGNKDTLIGGQGDDRLFGGTAGDYLTGGEGNDLLNGGTYADFLYGGVGSDTLIGGDQIDQLHGGAGSDTFIFENGHPIPNLAILVSNDRIMDFTPSVDKLIFKAPTGVTSWANLLGHSHTTSLGLLIENDIFGSVLLIDITIAELNRSDVLFA